MITPTKSQLKTVSGLYKKALHYPFYKRKYGTRLREIITYGDFLKIPLLSRFELSDRMISIKPSYLMKSRGDEQGNDPVVPITFREYGNMVNHEEYKFRHVGVRGSDRCTILDFTINHTPPMIQSLLNLGCTYIVFEGSDSKIFSDMVKRKVTVVFTHIRMVDKLIDFIKKTEIKTSLRLVITAGEKIPDLLAKGKEVKSVLGATLIDYIGTRELLAYATQTPNRLEYLFLQHQLVEVINPETGMPDEEGEIVITPFWKTECPLMRLRTGDYIKLTENNGFESLKKPVGGGVKIGSTSLLRLPALYECAKNALCYQGVFDRIFWVFISKPLCFLILKKNLSVDKLLFLVEKEKFYLSLRRKTPVSDKIAEIVDTSFEIVPVSRSDMKNLDLKNEFADIRYYDNNRIPSGIKKILSKYT